MSNKPIILSSDKPIILSCDGNIGAGKSTILEKLQTLLSSKDNLHMRILFMKEPVDEWQTIIDPVSGENILQKFYMDPRKYAFSFQIMAYATRMNMLKRLISENQKEGERLVIICERCLETDKHVFAKMLHDDGCIDEIHYQIYNHVSLDNPFEVDGIIYLESDPQICMRRINNRARSGESEIGIDYLIKCHNYHESWFTDMKQPILRLNVNQDVSYSESDMGMVWLQHIIDFIQNMCNE
jgi:deoxyadenosine/deoxycytidine kinase